MPDADEARPQRVSFVVRFADKPSADRTEWRGQVEHVPSGKKRSFQEAEQLLKFLTELASEARRYEED